MRPAKLAAISLIAFLSVAVVPVHPAAASWYLKYYYKGPPIGATPTREVAQAPGPVPARQPLSVPVSVPTPVSANGSTLPSSAPPSAAAPTSTATTAGPVSSTVTAEEAWVFNALNQARVAEGLSPLKLDLTLTALAREKARDMVVNNYFSHTSPTLGTAFEMMKRAGVNFTSAGENLGEAGSVYAVHYRLLASPTHRANILNPLFSEVGIGVVDLFPSGVMVAEFFVGH